MRNKVVVMEEKERYINLSDRQVKDTQNNSQGFMSINSICKTLNQQDKRIKELNTKLVEEMEFSAQRREIIEQLTIENRELKQQLHDLPKKIVREIRDVAEDYQDYDICEECGNIIDLHTLSKKDFDEILDTILKNYGGEDE